MRTAPLLPALALLVPLLGCPSEKKGPSGRDLVDEVKVRSSERERKLPAWRFDGVAEDLTRGEQLPFRFAYRAPNRMRAEVEGATPQRYAFDGTTLRALDVNKKQLTVWNLTNVPRDQAEAFVHEVFGPFAPEGFRAPLLPAGVKFEAQLIGEGDNRRAELRAVLMDPNGAMRFTHGFKYPSMEFTGKLVEFDKLRVATLVTATKCFDAVGVCVPQTVEERQNDVLTMRTTLSHIELDAPLPEGEFTIALPEGGTEVAGQMQ